MSDYPKIVYPDGTEFYLVSAEDVEAISRASEWHDELVHLRIVNASNDGRILNLRRVLNEINAKTDEWSELEEDDSDYSVDGGTIIVNPGDSIQDAIDKAEEGDIIILKEGVHSGTFNLEGKKNITIEGEGEVLVDNMIKVDDNWLLDIEEGVYERDYMLPGSLWHWRGDHEGDSFNNELMFPLLPVVGDDPLLYNPDFTSTLNYGEFSASNHRLRVRLREGEKIEDLKSCQYGRILWGNEETEGITLKNIKFKGCSNTGKTGALNFPGKGWRVSNVTMDLANTIAFEMGQGGEKADMRSQVQDSVFEYCMATRAGQQGWWGSMRNTRLVNCGHIDSNWRGFDHWWEASHKFENSHDCDVINWYAKDCNGPGFWLDGVRGGNTNIAIENPRVINCSRSGIDLELDTSNCTVINPMIEGIRSTAPNPAKNWNVAAAISIKAGCKNNTIQGGYVSGPVDEIVRLDNEDSRSLDPEIGYCTGNKISGIEVISDLPDEKVFRVLGDKLDNEMTYIEG